MTVYCNIQDCINWLPLNEIHLMKNKPGFTPIGTTNQYRGRCSFSNIEIKSINSRYLEVNHKIPRLFSEDEDAILSLIRKKLLRGKIILNINYTLLNDNLNQIKLVHKHVR